ncbi:tenascin-R-like [Mya arenaria]|uniref:tenascin-R-like n=1 Tax=Mya arenaria TaxID=6604 RepID=UPI0022E0D018|nr:tenascin-R-like [Mya arenaria]
MTHPNGTTAYATYQVFELGNLKSKYELTVDGYEGTAGDSLSYHSGQPFSTYDRDNDAHSTNCAAVYKGAWWHKSCHQSNLNGEYGNDAYGTGLNWLTFSTYNKSLKSVEMKIRRMP